MQTTAQQSNTRAGAPKLVHDVLRQPGQPLQRATRTSMESRFGRDFSGVRVHTGADAERAVTAVGADAWTVGRHIAFRHPHIAPQLLTHELGHVVQQRNAEAAADGALEIGEAHDHFERDADAGATAVTGAPRLQRGFLDVVRDIALFIPRLFGAGGYSTDELKEYVEKIKKSGKIEGGLFSDNKARGAVAAEKAIGSFDRNTKVLLIQEMLKGYTGILDENSIIDLLKRQEYDERMAVVNQIGREKLWSNFSFGNLRIIKALTYTANDAKPSLVAEFRGMSSAQLKEVEANTGVKEVKDLIEVARMLKTITAPVPNRATLAAPPSDPKAQEIPGGDLPALSAKVSYPGLDVYALPDKVIPSLGNRAFTDFYLHYSMPQVLTVDHHDSAEDTVATFDPPVVNVLVRTRWGSKEAPSKKPTYGVGTRPGDVPELRAHESSHGRDWYHFFDTKPAPVFGGKAGMTVDAFQNEAEKFRMAVLDWHHQAQIYSTKNTDCVGTLPTDQDPAPTGLKASICYE